MTGRTRYFVIVSLLVLLVGVGTGLVAYYAGFPGAFASQGGVDDLRLLPADTQFVAYADVREVMSSELRQKIRTILPVTGEGQREIFEQTGINIETDIDQIIAAFAPPRGAERMPGAPLVLAHGTFDTARIEGLMRQRGAQVEEYKGIRLIVAAPLQTPPSSAQVPASVRSDNFAVAFIEPRLAALGGRSLIQAAIDQKSGGPGATGNTELMSLVRSLDGGDVWAVGRFDTLASQARLPDGLAGQLPSITWFAANARVDSGIRGMLRADARDEQAAGTLRDLVRGLIALARLQAGSQPELKAALESLVLGGEGATVSVAFDVPGSTLDRLGAAVGGLHAGRRSLRSK